MACMLILGGVAQSLSCLGDVLVFRGLDELYGILCLVFGIWCFAKDCS